MANALGELFSNIATAIRGKTGDTEKMKPIEFPAAIAGIKVGGADTEEIDDLLDEINGEFIAEAQYTFTFIGASGEVLCEVPVYDTQDCDDPITAGIITKPTKEPTTELSFTYSHWSATEGGSADSSIFRNVTEDRTVYAVFTSSARIYTIKFWDGETLLKSASYQYGATPSCNAGTKVGYVFDSWSPEIVAVTGDASYYAVWSDKITFADGTWTDIARIAESGQPEKYWSVGDTKTFKDRYGFYDLTIKIRGLNHDDLADGTGKAGVTVSCEFVYGNAVNSLIGTGTQLGWEYSAVRTQQVPAFLNYLPAELASIIKTVRKEQLTGTEMSYTDDTAFLFTGYELSVYHINSGYYTNIEKDGGTPYAGFLPDSNGNYTKPLEYDQAGNSISEYNLLRSYHSDNDGMYVHYPSMVKNDMNRPEDSDCSMRFGFCI